MYTGNVTYHNRVRVDGTRDMREVDLAGLRVNRDRVHLDAHVRCALVKRRVRGNGHNPAQTLSAPTPYNLRTRHTSRVR